MEYRLPTLFEKLSELPKPEKPFNKLDRALRNHLIADMMNSGILQFSQAAVDEILNEVNTKEKLDAVYKQVQELKSKLPKRAPPAGSTFIVDTLPDGSLPVLNTNKDVEYLTEAIYKGLDIDKPVSNIPYWPEQVKTPAPSKAAIEEKKSEIKERIKSIEANSFTRPGMPTPRQLVTPSDFLAELSDMGVLQSSFEEQDQLATFVRWTDFNYDSLRNFIKVFRKCKSPVEKKILIPAIKEVIRDINSSRTTTYGDAYGWQNLLNRLVNCNIFLTAKEKETFLKWSGTDRSVLERKITDLEFSKLGLMYDDDPVSELTSANDIRDFILKVNRTKDHQEHEAVLKDIQEGEPLKSPTLRRTIKDMVHKLRVWGVIDNNAEACDTQYNKCMKWSQKNVENIERELVRISEGVLLFEELTHGQMEFLRANISYYNDFPLGTLQMNPAAPTPTPTVFTAQPLNGFDISPASASFKYNDQFTTVTTPGLTLNTNGVSIKGSSINLESPNVQINGRYIDFDKLVPIDQLAIKPEVIKTDIVTTEDLSNWKDLWSQDKSMFQKNPGVFDWQHIPATTDLNKPKENSQFIGEVKKAGVRVAATQLNKVTKGIIAAALPGDKSAALQQFLDSELGTSFVSMINGMALTYGLKDSERAQIMAKEFRISSLTTAGNFAVEEILELVSGVIADSLAENISDSIQKIDDEEIEITYEDIIEEKLLKA
jgi:hypothetical protein